MSLGPRLTVIAAFATFGAFSIQAEVRAQAARDVRAVMQIDNANESPTEITYFLGDQMMRMDINSDMSLISTAGSAPRTLMVQHSDRRYIEWTPEQLEMMRKMMSRFGGGRGNTVDEVDPTTVSFEQTGRTEQIGPWSASEVRMTTADGQNVALWLTEDAEMGLLEISLRAADAANLLGNPMTGGNTGGSQAFLRYRQLASAQGLPDGRVVRIVSTDRGDTTTMTLVDADFEPLPDETFAPPSGYERMQMPSIPGFPE